MFATWLPLPRVFSDVPAAARTAATELLRLRGLVGMLGEAGAFPGEAGRTDERSVAFFVTVGKLITSKALGRTKIPWFGGQVK